MEQFVIVVHTADGPGSSRAYGPFDDLDAAVNSVPRVMSVAPDCLVAEVVAVAPWAPSAADPDLRTGEESAPVH